MEKPAKLYEKIPPPKLNGLGTPCPPPDFTLRETFAFRWGVEKIDDERNFMPQFLKKPQRFIETADQVKCQAIGLSVFDSEKAFVARFQEILAVMGNRAFISIGTHLAQGHLDKESGECDMPNHTGHFTLHPFEGPALEKSFTIIRIL